MGPASSPAANFASTAAAAASASSGICCTMAFSEGFTASMRERWDFATSVADISFERTLVTISVADSFQMSDIFKLPCVQDMVTVGKGLV